MRNPLVILLFLIALACDAQNEKVRFSTYEGLLTAGYVNQGGFINFGGPGISYSTRGIKWIIGMLPSLRLKAEQGTTKNSFVTPSLGVGLTCNYKWGVFQIPLYYKPKSNTTNGRWHVGLGLGLRLDKLGKKS